MAKFHSSLIGGHPAELKTYQRIAAELYCESMRKDVHKYVSECRICQQKKYLSTTPARLLQPIPIPTHVWDEVTLDFIEGLHSSGGYNVIFVVVDRISMPISSP